MRIFPFRQMDKPFTVCESVMVRGMNPLMMWFVWWMDVLRFWRLGMIFMRHRGFLKMVADWRF